MVSISTKLVELKTCLTTLLFSDWLILFWQKAEAEFRLGNTASALSLVNEIRARAGVDDFTTLTEDNLLAERGREMFAEMTRRQDLIRFGRFGDAWWEKPASTEQYENWPIPQPQVDANANLNQHPGF